MGGVWLGAWAHGGCRKSPSGTCVLSSAWEARKGGVRCQIWCNHAWGLREARGACGRGVVVCGVHERCLDLKGVDI